VRRQCNASWNQYISIETCRFTGEITEVKANSNMPTVENLAEQHEVTAMARRQGRPTARQGKFRGTVSTVRVFLLLIWAVGCRSAEPSRPATYSESKSQASSPRIPSETSAQQLLGTYTGTLPCADCRGIRTELSLYVKDPNQFREATYKLTETYLGTRDGDRTFESVERWTIFRGNEADPNATIYQLSYDQPRNLRNFRRVSEEELRLLDGQQNEIKSEANLSLRRSRASLVGGYVPVDAADDRVRAAADFAVADETKRLNQTIRLQDISHAERQIVAGTNYRLCLKVGTNTGSQFVETVVYQDLKDRYSLTSWTYRQHC